MLPGPVLGHLVCVCRCVCGDACVCGLCCTWLSEAYGRCQCEHCWWSQVAEDELVLQGAVSVSAATLCCVYDTSSTALPVARHTQWVRRFATVVWMGRKEVTESERKRDRKKEEKRRMSWSLMINQAATTSCVAVQRRSVYTEEVVRYPILKDWYPVLKDPRFITESLSGVAAHSWLREPREKRRLLSLRWCFTSTETVWFVRDGQRLCSEWILIASASASASSARPSACGRAFGRMCVDPARTEWQWWLCNQLNWSVAGGFTGTWRVQSGWRVWMMRRRRSLCLCPVVIWRKFLCGVFLLFAWGLGHADNYTHTGQSVSPRARDT